MLPVATEDHSSHVSNLTIQPQFLANLLHTLNECVIVVDLHVIIVYWNQGAQRILGYSEAEVLGKYLQILCPEENKQHLREYIKLADHQGLYKGACEALRKDKTKVWLEICLSRLSDADGVSNGYVLIAHDITDRKEAIEALSESEKRFKTLFESIPDAILLTDAESGIILDANPATARLFEKPVDQIIGLSQFDLHPEESREKIKRIYAELPMVHGRDSHGRDARGSLEGRPSHGRDAHLTGGTPMVHGRDARGSLEGRPSHGRDARATEEFFETEILRTDNVRMPVEIHSRMISYRGRKLILETIRDLTQRKIAEKALLMSSRLEATGTLAGGLAHDINNLMATVMGNAELLKMDLALSSESEPLMDAILRSAERAGKLAHEMLAFARQGKYQTNQINLNHVVTESLLLLSRLKPPRINIKKELADDLLSIIADSSQINQAIVNVYNNAVEALQGEGELLIRTSNVELENSDLHDISDAQPGTYVLLAISDNGCGMSDETKQMAFEPFFSTKFTGRGMGLAAVYGIVKNHNGYITIDSAVDIGTTVSMYFPALLITPPSPEKPKDSLVGGTETILVVDDDETILAITRLQLEHLGYTVLTAENGKIALDLAQSYESEIHLTLLDLKMPVMDGPATFDPLRELRPNVKFVIYSGFELDQEAQSLLDKGAYAFLSKPTQFSTLAITVRNALDENELV